MARGVAFSGMLRGVLLTAAAAAGLAVDAPAPAPAPALAAFRSGGGSVVGEDERFDGAEAAVLAPAGARFSVPSLRTLVTHPCCSAPSAPLNLISARFAPLSPSRSSTRTSAASFGTSPSLSELSSIVLRSTSGRSETIGVGSISEASASFFLLSRSESFFLPAATFLLPPFASPRGDGLRWLPLAASDDLALASLVSLLVTSLPFESLDAAPLLAADAEEDTPFLSSGRLLIWLLPLASPPGRLLLWLLPREDADPFLFPPPSLTLDRSSGDDMAHHPVSCSLGRL